MVVYVDSSSCDEETGIRVEKRLFPTPPEDHVETQAGNFAGSFSQAQTSIVSGSGLPSQPGDPTPQSMLRAMSSGHAYIGEDHWSHLRVGTLSDRLYSFFNSVSYVSNASTICIILYFLLLLLLHFVIYY